MTNEHVGKHPKTYVSSRHYNSISAFDKSYADKLVEYQTGISVATTLIKSFSVVGTNSIQHSQSPDMLNKLNIVELGND